MEINSISNTRVKQWIKYKDKKYRERDHKFLIEGEHLIQEAQDADIIECIIVQNGKISNFPNYETFEVSSEILKKLTDSVSGSWIMALCHYPLAQEEKLGNRIILLDDVQDPGNVGTIIRSALSFGYDSVVLSNHSVDVYNEKLIRSTQGAIFHIPVVRCALEELLHKLKEKGITIYATALQDAQSMSSVSIPEKVALIFGNEGKGIRQEILALSDQKVFIEMQTFESLNVAVAAGICMYYFAKNKNSAY